MFVSQIQTLTLPATKEPGNRETENRKLEMTTPIIFHSPFSVSRFALTNGASPKPNVFLTETQLIVAMTGFPSVANP